MKSSGHRALISGSGVWAPLPPWPYPSRPSVPEQPGLSLLLLGLLWKCQGPRGLGASLLLDPLGPMAGSRVPTRTHPPPPFKPEPARQLRAVQLPGPRAPQGSRGQLLACDPADPWSLHTAPWEPELLPRDRQGPAKPQLSHWLLSLPDPPGSEAFHVEKKSWRPPGPYPLPEWEQPPPTSQEHWASAWKAQPRLTPRGLLPRPLSLAVWSPLQVLCP